MGYLSADIFAYVKRRESIYAEKPFAMAVLVRLSSAIISEYTFIEYIIQQKSEKIKNKALIVREVSVLLFIICENMQKNKRMRVSAVNGYLHPVFLDHLFTDEMMRSSNFWCISGVRSQCPRSGTGKNSVFTRPSRAAISFFE